MVEKSNPQLIQLIQHLKESSYKNKSPIWRDLAKRLEKPLSKRAEVNLSKIERYLKKGELAVIPGKVLGSGNLQKPVTVAAFSISQSAKQKIVKAKGKILTIRELVKHTPKGKNVRIIG